jgi:hypothetical protein
LHAVHDGTLAALDRTRHTLSAVVIAKTASTRGIQVHGTDAARVEIDGARKIVTVFAASALINVDSTQHPVAPAGIVVETHVSKFDAPRMVAIGCLLAGSILTDADCLIGGILTVHNPASPAKLSLVRVAPLAPDSIIPGIARVIQISIARAPGEVECVSFLATAGIFYTNHRRPAIAGIAHELLPAASIDAAEPEVHRVRGKGTGTLETTELGRLPGEVPDPSTIATYFDFGRAID